MRELLWLNTTQAIVSWLSLLVPLAGALITRSYLKRSRWAVLLFGAFLLQTVVQLAAKALPQFISGSSVNMQRVSLFFLVTSMLGVLAAAALVVGSAGILYELTAHNLAAKQRSSS